MNQKLPIADLIRLEAISFRVNAPWDKMPYRVHTIIVGRNLPLVVQRLAVRPTMDVYSLLELILMADAPIPEDAIIQVISGPERGP